MTRHFGPSDLRFYLTDLQPCPYLPGRLERKMFTPLRGADAQRMSDILSRKGFRRSQSVAYRPRCPNCMACVSVRIPVNEFTPKRTFRRILKRNARLRRFISSAAASQEQYDLFRHYLDMRHTDGAMTEMEAIDFASMIEDSPTSSYMIEYRDPENGDALIAAALTDLMRDGLSMVYSFYNPYFEQDSLGGYMILDHVAAAREHGLPYVYLGYWIRNARKMAYKARFQPLEGLVNGEWRRLTPEELAPDGPLVSPETHPRKP